jgi:hypothetical protein
LIDSVWSESVAASTAVVPSRPTKYSRPAAAIGEAYSELISGNLSGPKTTRPFAVSPRQRSGTNQSSLLKMTPTICTRLLAHSPAQLTIP